MSKPMDIDFAVDVPDQALGDKIAQLASQRGYATTVKRNASGQRWPCCCTKRVVPTYEVVVVAQKELDELSAPFGGHSDGWGTFGNRVLAPTIVAMALGNDGG